MIKKLIAKIENNKTKLFNEDGNEFKLLSSRQVLNDSGDIYTVDLHTEISYIRRFYQKDGDIVSICESINIESINEQDENDPLNAAMHVHVNYPNNLFTINDLAKKYSILTVGGIKWWLRNRNKNGLQESGALCKVGKRLFIYEPKFIEWLQKHKLKN